MSGLAFLFALFKPFLLRLEPERAHRMTLALLRGARLFIPYKKAPDILRCHLWGREFPSPIGLAAGFDKNGIVAAPVIALGFGFAEVGTATPLPQKGNPRPRLFRLPEQQAVINRMGFNNDGLPALIKNASRYKTSRYKTGIIGINIGPNATKDDRIQDYITAIQQIEQMDRPPAYIAINVSSPNTENLRQFESVAQLETLLDRITTKLPLLVKLSPDLEDDAYQDIAQLAVEKNLGGLIAVNTTIKHEHKQTGGLSGAPLAARAGYITGLLYRAAKGKIPIISVGGVASGAEAYHRIRQGASLVQLYTALIWHGPALIGRINRDLADHLARDGFSSLAEAVGAAHNGQVK